jgi:hypothetical protein
MIYAAVTNMIIPNSNILYPYELLLSSKSERSAVVQNICKHLRIQVKGLTRLHFTYCQGLMEKRHADRWALYSLIS